MKRFASHFLFLPAYGGYLKQYAVETEEGRVVRIFPITEELENVEWLPGAIVLLTQETLKELDITSSPKSDFQNCSKMPAEFYYNSVRILLKFSQNLLKTPPPFIDGNRELFPVYFSDFDITTMLPVAGTRHRLLR